MIQRPETSEYAEFYADYVRRVPDGDVCEILDAQLRELADVFSRFSDKTSEQPHIDGAWTPKQILGHLCDAERVFGYRALRISRGDATALPGFDQDVFVRASNSNGRHLNDLLQEFEHLRKANLALFRSIPDDASRLLGSASGYPVSVRALLYITAGHASRHLHLIRERYGT